MAGSPKPLSQYSTRSVTGDYLKRGKMASKRGQVLPLENHSSHELGMTTAACRLDCGDVDFFHRHHRIERALGRSGIGTGDRFRQRDRRNLPGQSPFVRAPAARVLLAAIADDRVPVAIRFVLVSGGYLKRECPVVLDPRSAVEPEARYAHHRKLDREHIPFLPRRKVARGEVHGIDGRIGKGLCVKLCCVFSIAIVP
jgi:hypothetical protein